jgi:hypothetical protein
LNLQLGLLFKLADQKSAKFADPYQMIERQTSYDHEDNGCRRKKKAELENFFHREPPARSVKLVWCFMDRISPLE